MLDRKIDEISRKIVKQKDFFPRKIKPMFLELEGF
jgi:hypothetical protein